MRWLFLVPLAVSPLTAQPGRDDVVVSVEWLARQREAADLVLLHVGPASDYRAGHIPGARHADHVHRMARGLTLELPAPDAFERELRALGISDDSRVVVYQSGGWVTPATRWVLELTWAGVDAVFLDGGLPAWRAAGLPVSRTPPPDSPGTVRVRPRSDLVVTADWVQQNVGRPGMKAVDARPRAFYDGVRADRGKRGHIPGAGSLPWVELIGEDGRLKRPDDLRALFTDAGVAPGDTVVAYCHIGQFATAVMLAARSLGHPVRLYDGAMEDWARRNLPVELPR